MRRREDSGEPNFARPGPRSVWPRVVVRFVASVALVSGVLLLVDAAVTLAWQEPLSALVASRGQDRLDDELAARFAEEREAPDRGGNRRIRAKRMAGSLRRGDALGRIVLPTLGRRYAIAEGTDSGTLRAAPGHYPATGLPGEGTTVAVAGHRTTYGAPFRTIDDLYRGDAVIVEMPYGRFTYRVSATRIVRPDETWVVRRVGRERLVLTACHPLYSARERIVVFAELVGRPSSSGASRRSSKTSSPPTSASETASTMSQ